VRNKQNTVLNLISKPLEDVEISMVKLLDFRKCFYICVALSYEHVLWKTMVK